MYMVFVAGSDCRNGVMNTFKALGMLELISTLYRRYDGNVEVWQLEFDATTPTILTRVRRALDAWAPYEHPLLVEVLETDWAELELMLATPDPPQPSLSWCIQRYRQYHCGCWQDYWGAVGRCLTVPDDFLSFLRAKGCINWHQIDSGYARVVTIYFGDKAHETPDFPRECHRVVQIGRIVVDWTARQYPNLYEARGYNSIPVPLVWINETREDQVFAPSRKAPAVAA